MRRRDSSPASIGSSSVPHRFLIGSSSVPCSIAGVLLPVLTQMYGRVHFCQAEHSRFTAAASFGRDPARFYIFETAAVPPVVPR